jgi:hypothetical protein
MNETPSLQASENAAASVAVTQNRVTLDSIKAKVAQVEYYNPPIAPHMTIALVKMRNGFIVTGESTPADPANFNAELGQRFAYEDALRKVWPLEGYSLREWMEIAADVSAELAEAAEAE